MSAWGVLCVVFGGLCGLLSILFFVLDLLRYRKAVGMVIGHDSTSGESGTMYLPKIRFRTEVGTYREFQSICYFDSEPINEGAEVPVRYHPTYDKLNGVDKLAPRFMGVMLFAVCAGLFIWLGLQI